MAMETWCASWELIRIIIPVAILTRILQEYGMIEYFGTIVMFAIGGKTGGIFWGRIVFSFLVTFILVKLLQRPWGHEAKVLAESMGQKQS